MDFYFLFFNKLLNYDAFRTCLAWLLKKKKKKAVHCKIKSIYSLFLKI